MTITQYYDAINASFDYAFDDDLIDIILYSSFDDCG